MKKHTLLSHSHCGLNKTPLSLLHLNTFVSFDSRTQATTKHTFGRACTTFVCRNLVLVTCECTSLRTRCGCGGAAQSVIQLRLPRSSESKRVLYRRGRRLISAHVNNLGAITEQLLYSAPPPPPRPSSPSHRSRFSSYS